MRSEAPPGVGERQHVHERTGTAHRAQAVHVAQAVGVVEDLEERTVDDGVETRAATQARGVCHLESGRDPASGRVVSGQVDGPGAAPGVENRTADGAATLEFRSTEGTHDD